MKTNCSVASLLCALVFAANVNAEEPKVTPGEKKPPLVAQYLFDRKITHWIEGTVVTINEKQFILNKTQSFFAAKYAQMLNEINENTTNFSPTEAAIKATEIRARWHREMKDQKEDVISDAEMAFLLPQQPGGLHVIDESGLYAREGISPTGDSRKTVADAYGKASNWGDVKKGDRIVVGYRQESDNRNAMVIIRVTSLARSIDAAPRGKRAAIVELQN